jgi:ABC-type Zn uptake system ZnuABC Zn-binding protein ZnuA
VRAQRAGDQRVTQIIQPNTDAHEYEPRPQDIRATAGARVVLQSGDGLDDWMRTVIRQSGAQPEVRHAEQRGEHRRPPHGSSALG